MNTTTTVAVTCDCKIPFHDELVNQLEQLFASPDADLPDLMAPSQIKNRNMILQSKMIFVKITNPIKKVRPKLLETLRKLLNKELVGTIKGSKNEVTLILV